MPDHASEARQYAEALFNVHEARDHLHGLVRREMRHDGEGPEDYDYEASVAQYQEACGRLKQATEALHEAQSLDTRPLCTECFRRLDSGELAHPKGCPAFGYQQAHIVKEKP